MKLTEAMTPTGNPQSTCVTYMRIARQLTTGTLCQLAGRGLAPVTIGHPE
jgi:hypothetical protein